MVLRCLTCRRIDRLCEQAISVTLSRNNEREKEKGDPIFFLFAIDHSHQEENKATRYGTLANKWNIRERDGLECPRGKQEPEEETQREMMMMMMISSSMSPFPFSFFFFFYFTTCTPYAHTHTKKKIK